jgi:transcriptional regulator with XRE-family HTH domain
VGRRVAELRKAKLLTQEQLAERLKVSTRYLQNIEGGRENLTLETMVTLGRKLGVDAADLLSEPMSRKPASKGRPPRGEET